jgi:hypothetical protein
MGSYPLPKHSQPFSDRKRKGPEILRTKPVDYSVRENHDSFATEYYCTAEWHLAQMASKYVAPLYGIAQRLSWKSKMFYASQLHLANYFGCSRRTIWAAVRDLETTGFLVLRSSSPFRTNVYTVLDHDSWVERNPGKCTTKIEMPWSAEGPLLGRELHAISGGRVKFRPEQIEYLKFNFTDEEIKRGFRRLLARGVVSVDRHDFIDMKNLDWEALCLDV